MKLTQSDSIHCEGSTEYEVATGRRISSCKHDNQGLLKQFVRLENPLQITEVSRKKCERRLKDQPIQTTCAPNCNLAHERGLKHWHAEMIIDDVKAATSQG